MRDPGEPGSGTDTGEGSDDGGDVVDAPPNPIDELRDKFDENLDSQLSKGDCAKKLGPYAKQLKDLVKSKSLTVRSFNPKKDGKKKVAETGETLAQFFARFPGGAATTSRFRQRGNGPKKWSHQIVLGPQFPSGAEGSTLFIHETLHALFPEADNATLMNIFGISIPGLAGDVAVTEWLKNGCKNAP